MSSVRDVKTKFSFEVDHDKLEKLEGSLESIKHRLAFLGGVELAHILFEMSEKFSALAENIHVASVSAGIGVEQFQKLANAARLSAVPQDQLETSLARLARSLQKARDGSSEAQMAFSKAGFTPEQVRGFKTSQDALLALSDKIKGIDDPIRRAALAQQLLGRGSQRMVGFLAQGKDAIQGLGEESERYGAVLNERQIEGLVRAERALQKFGMMIRGVGATIAANFAPNIEAAIERTLKFYEANRHLIEVNIKTWVENAAYGFGVVYGIVEGLIIQLIRLATYFHLENDILPWLAKIVGAVGGLLAVAQAFSAIGSAINSINKLLLITSLRMAPLIPLAAALGLAGYAAYKLDKSAAEATGHESMLQHFTKGNSFLGGLVSGYGLLPQSIAGTPTAFQNNAAPESVYQIMAPVTQNITGSNAEEIGKSATKGITDHVTQTQNRAVRRGVTSARAY